MAGGRVVYQRRITILVAMRAETADRRRGKRVEAAELARWLAFLHAAVHGNTAAANGWMARAESLLDGVQQCAAHGWMTLDRAPWTDDAWERERLAPRRSPSPAVSATPTSSSARWPCSAMRMCLRTRGGGDGAARPGDGGGHGRRGRRHATVGEIYCRLLGACERVADVRRAEQWMSAAAASWPGRPSCARPVGCTTAGS